MASTRTRRRARVAPTYQHHSTSDPEARVAAILAAAVALTLGLLVLAWMSCT